MSESQLEALARAARGVTPSIVPRIASRFEPTGGARFGERALEDETTWDDVNL